jgi:hypothetical protein
MNTKEIVEQALKLKPKDLFTPVEGLIKSLDEPDKKLEEIFKKE